MDIVLKIMGGSLGLLVPWLFAFPILEGIERAPLGDARKASSKRLLITLVTLWTVTVWALSLAGVISYHEGDRIPRVLIPLFLPVVVGVVALANQDFRRILDHSPLVALVGVQSFRFAGAAFLLIVHLGILPAAFVSGGYGDLATATLAAATAVMLARGKPRSARTLFWAFTIAGLCDLLSVAYLMLRYYPAWYHGSPTSAPTADFALVMIPAIAAPFALLLHAYAIRHVVMRGVR